MSEQAAPDSHYRFQLHIPGWLLALAIIIGMGLWGGRCVADAFDGGDDGANFRFPSRITALDASFENRVLTATVLVESNESYDPRTLGFGITLDDSTHLEASARQLGGGPWPGRSYVMVIERLIPEGRTPRFLGVTGANGSASFGLGEVLD